MRKKMIATFVGALAAVSVAGASTASAERIDPHDPGPKGVVVKPIAWVAPVKVCTSTMLATWDGPPTFVHTCVWKCPAGTVAVLTVGKHDILCRDY